MAIPYVQAVAAERRPLVHFSTLWLIGSISAVVLLTAAKFPAILVSMFVLSSVSAYRMHQFVQTKAWIRATIIGAQRRRSFFWLNLINVLFASFLVASIISISGKFSFETGISLFNAVGFVFFIATTGWQISRIIADRIK